MRWLRRSDDGLTDRQRRKAAERYARTAGQSPPPGVWEWLRKVPPTAWLCPDHGSEPINSPCRSRVVVVRDDLDGGYVATMPNRPGIAGQGETQAEAVLDCIAAERERREVRDV